MERATLELVRANVARLRTIARRIQADLDRAEPILIRLEALAKAGTHGDLQGNGMVSEEGG